MMRVRTRRSGQRVQLVRGKKAPVIAHRHDRNRARAVISDDQVSLGGIKGGVDRIVALAILLVDERQPTAGPIDCEGADQVPPAMHAVKPTIVATQRKQRWILETAYMLEMRPASTPLVDSVDVDAVAAAVAVRGGIAADIGEHGVSSDDPGA